MVKESSLQAIPVLQVSNLHLRAPLKCYYFGAVQGIMLDFVGLEIDFVRVDQSLGCSWTHKRLMYKLEHHFIYSKESYNGRTDLNVQVSLI